VERQKVLEMVKFAVHEVDKNATVILFGSRVRGDYHNESDWDLLILTEMPEGWETWMMIRKKIYRAELDTEEIFNTVVHNKYEWEKYKLSPLYQFIKREGMKI